MYGLFRTICVQREDVRSAAKSPSAASHLLGQLMQRHGTYQSLLTTEEHFDTGDKKKAQEHVFFSSLFDCARWLSSPLRHQYPLLVIMCTFVAVLTHFINVIMETTWSIQNYLFDLPALGSPYSTLRFLLTTLFRLAIILLAVSITALGPHAAGSGIPELKAILAGGVHMKGYLSLKTLIVKILALSCALGSGLPVGKEGPFVHISAIVGSKVSRYFGPEASSRQSLLIGSAAAGIAACFGAPIGGLLFSIESTSYAFQVDFCIYAI